MSPKLGFVPPALALAVDGHARPTATNKPVGDNARKGSVELDNPLTKPRGSSGQRSKRQPRSSEACLKKSRYFCGERLNTAKAIDYRCGVWRILPIHSYSVYRCLPAPSKEAPFAMLGSLFFIRAHNAKKPEPRGSGPRSRPWSLYAAIESLSAPWQIAFATRSVRAISKRGTACANKRARIRYSLLP
jgi:hypothetical protein